MKYKLLINYQVIRDYYTIHKSEFIDFEISPFSLKPKLLAILESYNEQTDYQLLEVESAELLSIVCHNSTLVSQIMFTFSFEPYKP